MPNILFHQLIGCMFLRIQDTDILDVLFKLRIQFYGIRNLIFYASLALCFLLMMTIPDSFFDIAQQFNMSTEMCLKTVCLDALHHKTRSKFLPPYVPYLQVNIQGYMVYGLRRHSVLKQIDML